MPQPDTRMLIPPPGLTPTTDDEAVLLWHDDVRRPPAPGWTWARTNDAAKIALAKGNVKVISLDHDLGGHNLDPDAPDTWLYRGPSTEPTGLQLVDWMIAHRLVPERVSIHSWNGDGVSRMYKTLTNAGYLHVYIEPYVRPAPQPCDRCGEITCWRVGGAGHCSEGASDD